MVVGYLKDNLDKLVLDGGIFYMRCAAHVLNLAVRDALIRLRILFITFVVLSGT